MTATDEDPAANRAPTRGRLMVFCLTALGVVFGDIGTSPLYAMRECFHGPHGIDPSRANVFGVLSLIFWALIMVISVKYLFYILRADHSGEGGIMALSALAHQFHPKAWVIVLGLFGSALLYADGMITPAITVLGAVEGLRVATPALAPLVIPISVVILIALFLVQRYGSGTIGGLFGPIMILWFATLAILGISQIIGNPSVLLALNPYHAVRFFLENGPRGYIVLGSIFLVVTGGEALYADLGHFGAKPIRYVWTFLVLPSLVINYLGQGALLLREPHAARNLFYEMAPHWALYPMVALATMAAIIASQALISGAFSLTMQAVQLGFCPRMTIRHTSAAARGQIFLPTINRALLVACILLVVAFRSSSNLAAAYGVSITATMTITSLLFFAVARHRWKWPLWTALLWLAIFLPIDLAFMGANLAKLLNGGWFPLAVALAIYLLMATWRKGRKILATNVKERAVPLELLLQDIRAGNAIRVKGTACFMTGNPDSIPGALLHNLKHNRVLHDRVIILNVRIEETPEVPAEGRREVKELPLGFWRVTLRFGFMEKPNVSEALAAIPASELDIDPAQTSFFLGRETVLIRSKNSAMSRWRRALFVAMAQNARDATAYFSLPPNRVVELGMQIEI
jgi:KUP system potassium uptake protein